MAYYIRQTTRSKVLKVHRDNIRPAKPPQPVSVIKQQPSPKPKPERLQPAQARPPTLQTVTASKHVTFVTTLPTKQPKVNIDPNNTDYVKSWPTLSASLQNDHKSIQPSIRKKFPGRIYEARIPNSASPATEPTKKAPRPFSKPFHQLPQHLRLAQGGGGCRKVDL